MIGLGSLFGRRKTKVMTGGERTPPFHYGKRTAFSGRKVFSWWQDWMDHAEPGDPWWDAINYGAAAQTLPPTVMVGGLVRYLPALAAARFRERGARGPGCSNHHRAVDARGVPWDG